MAYFDEVAASAKDFSENLGAASRNATSTSTALHEASGHLISFTNVLKALGTYVGIKSLGQQVMEIAKGSAQWAKQVQSAKDEYSAAARELNALQEKRKKGEVVGEHEITSMQAVSGALQRHVNLLEFKEKLSLSVNRTLDQQGRVWLGAVVLGAVGIERAVAASHDLNKALVGTNPDLEVRKNLVNQILTAQQMTGVSLKTAAEAAKALTAYGLQLAPGFESNVESVVELEEGLGVSADASAKLATIWQQGIRQPVKDAADAVARIAAGTGLTADRAAEMLNSLGRSARLLGPGLQGSVAQTGEMLAGIAGKIQGFQGNYQIPQDLLRRASGGTSEGIKLASFGGVRSREDLVGSGAVKTLENMARQMREIVNADPSNNYRSYAIQLEQVGNLYGISAADAQDFMEAMKSQRVETDKSLTAEGAYNAQAKATGLAWSQLREALSSLYKQALLPLIKPLTWVVQTLADAAKYLVQSKAAVTALQIVAVPAAVLFTGKVIGLAASMVSAAGSFGLWGSFTKLLGGSAKALATDAAGAAKGVSGLSGMLGSLGLGSSGTSAGATGFVQYVKSLGNGLGLASKAGWIGVAAAVGVGLGKWLDENTTVHKIVEYLAKLAYPDAHEGPPITKQYVDDRSPFHARDEVASELLKGSKQGALDAMAKYASLTGDSKTDLYEAGAEKAEETLQRREFVRRSTSSTVKTDEDYAAEKKAKNRYDEIERWRQEKPGQDRLVQAAEAQLKLNREQDARDQRNREEDKVSGMYWFTHSSEGAYRLGLPAGSLIWNGN